MNDEVRAAAERRRLQAAKDILAASKTPEGQEDGAFDSESMWQLFEDGIVLASAYLAEHPADDGEAWTTGWLEDVGFEHGAYCGGCFQIRTEFGQWLRVLTINSMWRLSRNRLPDMATRRDVRDLCRALGIPLKETP